MSLWTRISEGLENPIIVKEGVSRMRTWRAPVVATLYLGLVGAVGFAFLEIAASTNAAAAIVGSNSFAAMAFFQLGLVSLFAPALAAGAISGERERQTLDVLLVSRVSAFGIVWGKLVASLAYMLLLILTALPLFAAVFLFGGIDFEQFILAQVITISTAICLGAIALFFSALFKRSLPATVASYAAGFALMIGTAVLSAIVNLGQAFAVRADVTPQLVAAEWYTNPFFALYSVLFSTSGSRVSVRGWIQLLLNGPPASGNLPTGGPVVEPWHITVSIEMLIAVACTVAAVQLVRGRRAFRPRRPVRESRAAEVA